jgi:hypothetical protein
LKEVEKEVSRDDAFKWWKENCGLGRGAFDNHYAEARESAGLSRTAKPGRKRNRTE